ncbi:MAG TPA: hypothetical protein VFV50_07245 [Bdellovibrionales bacterium]|nr:hypothetical protein [Bdellovibrionales bacterium]
MDRNDEFFKVLERLLARAAEETFLHDNDKPGSLGEVHELTVQPLLLQGKMYCVISASADRPLPAPILAGMLIEAKNALAGLGFAADTPHPAAVVACIPLDFATWSASTALARVECRHLGHETVIVICEAASSAAAEESPDPGFCAIAPEDLGREPCKVPTDLYLYLPLNRKFLLYLREGSDASAELLGKLGAPRIKSLFFKQSDLAKWLVFRVTRPPF